MNGIRNLQQHFGSLWAMVSTHLQIDFPVAKRRQHTAGGLARRLVGCRDTRRPRPPAWSFRPSGTWIDTDAHRQGEGAVLRLLPGRHRRGLSLMEVMFSIGVLLIGIVGLASILPMALRQSADAVATDKALMASESLINRTMAEVEHVIKHGALVPDRFSPMAIGGANNYYVKRLDAIDYRYGICVDPWFLAASTNKRDQLGRPDRVNFEDMNAYDRGVFPAYDRSHNPLVSPTIAHFDSMGNTTTAWGSFPWVLNQGVSPAYLRAIRVGPRFRRVAPAYLSTSFAINSTARPMYGAEQDYAAHSQTPALVTVDGDDSFPASRIFRAMGGSTAPSIAVDQDRYSAVAFVTSDPTIPVTTERVSRLRVSVAVYANRQTLTDPGGLNDTERFNLSPYTFDERSAPAYQGERIGYVPASTDYGGFRAGIGGRVQVVMNRELGTEDNPPNFLRGQHVMLMRNVWRPTQVGAPDQSPQRMHYEWFRISDVVGDVAAEEEGEAAAVAVNDPVHNEQRDVWRITLELRGPQWTFDDETGRNPYSNQLNYPGNSRLDDTFLVWLPEVVGVQERTLVVDET